MFMRTANPMSAIEIAHGFRKHNSAGRGPMSRQDLADHGRDLWEFTYRHGADDMEAFSRLCEYAQAHDPELYTYLLIPDHQITLLGAARWAGCGFPRIITSHSYASALMSTSVSEESLEFVHPPWPAFLLDIPTGLLSIDDPATGKLNELRWMLCHQVQTQDRISWNYIAYTDTVLCLWRHGVNNDMLCDEKLPSDCWHDASFIFHDDRDDRVASVLGRFIVGVCLSLSDPKNIKGDWKPGQSYEAGKKSQPPRDFLNIRLGKPISIDCRPSIHDYVNGNRSRIATVKSLVRGHWKMQPHGPHSSLRKVIWREPFWRGPEGAPVLVRPTKI